MESIPKQRELVEEFSEYASKHRELGTVIEYAKERLEALEAHVDALHEAIRTAVARADKINEELNNEPLPEEATALQEELAQIIKDIRNAEAKIEHTERAMAVLRKGIKERIKEQMNMLGNISTDNPQ